MNKDTFWTASRARLQRVRSKEGKKWNWIFLPGGPGLGSESLLPLFKILDLPGTMWRLDLPGDGSNIDHGATISHWPQALLEVADAFENVIMIGHSRGGMFLLSLPELEKKIKGLVLLGAAPDIHKLHEQSVSGCVGQPLNLRPVCIAQLIQVELLRRRQGLAQIQGASLPYSRFFM